MQGDKVMASLSGPHRALLSLIGALTVLSLVAACAPLEKRYT